MSATFLVQIQEAEEQAQKIVEKALENKQRSLQETRQRLAKKTKENIEAENDRLRQDLLNSRGAARQSFEKTVRKFSDESKTLEVEKGAMVDGFLTDVGVFLLQEMKAAA